jgi:hypothetical protein
LIHFRLKNSLKDKAKVKPAPIVEAGYSLYSAASENSVTGDLDTCGFLVGFVLLDL